MVIVIMVVIIFIIIIMVMVIVIFIYSYPLWASYFLHVIYSSSLCADRRNKIEDMLRVACAVSSVPITIKVSGIRQCTSLATLMSYHQLHPKRFLKVLSLFR